MNQTQEIKLQNGMNLFLERKIIQYTPLVFFSINGRSVRKTISTYEYEDTEEKIELTNDERMKIYEIRKEMEKPTRGNMRAIYADSDYESQIGHGENE